MIRDIHLTTVLDNGSNQLAVPDDRLHLFRNRLLLVVPIFASGNGNVQTADAAGDDLYGIQTLLAQVDIARVGLFDVQGRAQAKDLSGERRRRGDAQLRDNRVEEDRCAVTVEQADGVDLALDLDDRVLACEHVYRLVDLRLVNDDFRIALVVFLRIQGQITDIRGTILQLTMFHFVPSNSVFAGFFWIGFWLASFEGFAGLSGGPAVEAEL